LFNPHHIPNQNAQKLTRKPSTVNQRQSSQQPTFVKIQVLFLFFNSFIVIFEFFLKRFLGFWEELSLLLQLYFISVHINHIPIKEKKKHNHQKLSILKRQKERKRKKKNKKKKQAILFNIFFKRM